jgi:hypothetical protein
LLVARFIQINLQWGKIQPGWLLVARYWLLVTRSSLKRKPSNEERATSNRFNPQSAIRNPKSAIRNQRIPLTPFFIFNKLKLDLPLLLSTADRRKSYAGKEKDEEGPGHHRQK